MSKRIIATTAVIFCFLQASSAEEVKISEAWVLNEVFQKALQYAGSISCDVVADRKNVVALVAWKNFEDPNERENAKYALVWYGDIGCLAGSGTVNPRITVVQISTGNHFIVDLNHSSPQIKFETTVRDISIINATKNELTLSGLAGGPDDPVCCPTIPVRIRLREDIQGNWKMIEKTQIHR